MDAIFTAAWALLSLAAVVHLLIFKREPASTIAWILFVTFVPILGAGLFLVFGPQRLERKAVKRKKELSRLLGSGAYPLHEKATGDALPGPFALPPPEEQDVLALARRVSQYGVTGGNTVELMNDPQSALAAMHEAVRQAKQFIHLEYYIIANDEVTQQLFEVLEKALERGVQVRVLYDALGSVFLKRKYFKTLVEKGARVAGFMPLSILPQRMNVNFRNHRKILVVDGATAFTGGTNIGREYLGRRNRHQWKDYTVRVDGPVVRQLQDVFATDWHFTTDEDLFQDFYYPDPPRPGDAIVQVLESGPDSMFETIQQTIFLAISHAQEEILLTTPYFIPDAPVLAALKVAALRGVTVKLVLPLKSDVWLVQQASRSFFDELLDAGIEIFEYQPRILHAKMLTIDRKWTMVGSANMDIRSFRLNFELNLLVYGLSVADQSVRLFEQDLAESSPLKPEEFRRRGLRKRMTENACRLLSPIL